MNLSLPFPAARKLLCRPLTRRTLLVTLLSFGAVLWSAYRLPRLLPPSVPAITPAIVPTPAAASAQIAAMHWFGIASPPAPPAITVVGVFAPEGTSQKPGFAVVRYGGSNLSLFSGQPLASWLVTSIAPGGLTLAHGSLQQFYPLSLPNHGESALDSTEGNDSALPPPGDEE